MGFKNFRLNVIVRVSGIIITVFLLVYLIKFSGYLVTSAIVCLLLIYQTLMLIRLMEKTNRELLNFLSSIRYDDFTHAYKLTDKGGSFDQLNEAFNEVIKKFRNIRTEKETDYQYLKNIIYHIGIGLISFDKTGKVQIINTAAKRLLKVNRLHNIEELKAFSPELTDNFKALRSGAKSLVRIRKNGEVVQLAIYAIELYLKGDEYKLITIQNIHSELEEQEMEAWQNLIRVLTHEIRNSVTPVSSLAAFVEESVGTLQKENKESNEELEDIQLAVQTIKRRSDAMIRFVSEFSSLTHIPTPKFRQVKVEEMFAHIKVLMYHDCEENQVELHTHIYPKALTITADQELLEQVLINITKNAIQALGEFSESEKSRKIVKMEAIQGKNSRPVIHVSDNGPGIDKDALDRIFIPFYTTKNTGSGIGLSLSRQIMRQHRGSISAKSTLGKGTRFSLKF